MRSLHKALVIATGLFVAIIPRAAKAQTNSPAGTVVLNATLPESITVKVTGGTTVNFALAPNTAANAGSTTSTIQTDWALKPGRFEVTVWAWVPNGSAALTDGAGDNIPASAVTAAAAGSGMAGGALNNVTSGGGGVPAFISPAAATGVEVGRVFLFFVFNLVGSTTTTLTWNINTTSVPQLAAATYTGIVNIQAQTIP